MALGYNEELAVSASELPGSVLIGDSRMVGIPEFTYLPNPPMSEQELTAFLLTIKSDPPAQSYESIHLGRLAKEFRPVAPETETLAHLQARLDAERKQAGLPRRVFIDRDGRICDSATFEAQRAELISAAQAAPSRTPTPSGIVTIDRAQYSHPPVTDRLAADTPRPPAVVTLGNARTIGAAALRTAVPTVEYSPAAGEEQLENVTGIVRIAAHGLIALRGPYTHYPADKQAWVKTPGFAPAILRDLYMADASLYHAAVRYFSLQQQMPMQRLIQAALLAYEGPQNSRAFIPVLRRSLQAVLAEAPHYSVRSRGLEQQPLVNR